MERRVRSMVSKRKPRGEPTLPVTEPPPPSSKNLALLREKVAERASYSCEYCQTPEQASFAPHQVDHIVSVKHGGKSGVDNLAFACTLCNRRKGSDLSSFDTETGQLAPLFHPRREQWHEHFTFKGGELVGLTPSGRATIHLLRLNHPHPVQERLLRFGWRWTRDSA